MITPTEALEVRNSTAEALEVEATYGSGEPPPKHLHPAQDEHFEVLSGSIRADPAFAVEADVFRLAGPDLLLRPALAALALIGRPRGYAP